MRSGCFRAAGQQMGQQRKKRVPRADQLQPRCVVVPRDPDWNAQARTASRIAERAESPAVGYSGHRFHRSELHAYQGLRQYACAAHGAVRYPLRVLTIGLIVASAFRRKRMAGAAWAAPAILFLRSAPMIRNARSYSAAAPWHFGAGTLAPWHPGTLAPWHPGTLAPWHPGTLAPWHLALGADLAIVRARRAAAHDAVASHDRVAIR